MSKYVFLAALGLAALTAAGSAEAACTCACVAGKPKAQCPSVFEVAPSCPASVCSSAQPAAPPMTKRENCEVVQVLDPQTQKVERRMVCK